MYPLSSVFCQYIHIMAGKLYTADALALPKKPLKRVNGATTAAAAAAPVAVVEEQEPPMKKPKRVMSDEQKENMKLARQAKKDAAEAAAKEAADAAKEAALRLAEKKAATLEKRRATVARKRAEQSASGSSIAPESVSGDVVVAAPAPEPKRKGKAAAVPAPAAPVGDTPPNWFNTIIELIERERAEQKGDRVTKKDLKAKAAACAEERWSDGMTRDRVRGAVDNHVSRMYEMIFG